MEAFRGDEDWSMACGIEAHFGERLISLSWEELMLGLFITFCVTSFHLYVLVFWTGIFLEFFSWTLLKMLSAQNNSEFNRQMMEFLVQLSHNEKSWSYDFHHMFLYSLYCIWHRFLISLAYSWKRSCGLIAQFCTLKND